MMIFTLVFLIAFTEEEWKNISKITEWVIASKAGKNVTIGVRTSLLNTSNAKRISNIGITFLGNYSKADFNRTIISPRIDNTTLMAASAELAKRVFKEKAAAAPLRYMPFIVAGGAVVGVGAAGYMAYQNRYKIQDFFFGR
jgi:hypothetical protein